MKKIYIVLLLLNISLFGFETVSKLSELKSKTSSGLTIVKFYEDFCPNCPTMSKNLEYAQKSGYRLIKVKLSDAKEIHAEFGVPAVPAIIILKDGQVIDKRVGVISTSELNLLLEYNKQ